MSTLTLDNRTTPAATDRPFNWALLAALLGVLGLSGVSLFTGVADLSPIDFLTGTATDEQKLNLFASRIPRTAAVLLAGAALALAGLLMQLLVRNRFVEPSTVGTSESASVGILLVAMIYPGAPLPLKMLVAIVTALIGTALFLRVIRSLPPQAPVVAIPLVGIMLAGIISAGTTFVAQRNDLLQSLGIWMAGDFSGVLRGRYEMLWLLAGVGLLMWLFADRFTVASLGKDTATSLGLSYRTTLNLGLALVAVASAVTLVIVGSIAFIGLIVPNLIAMWRGDNLRRNIGWTALMGSGFVLVCDLIARTINYPYEVPVGTVSGIIGGIIFLALLLSGRLRAR